MAAKKNVDDQYETTCLKSGVTIEMVEIQMKRVIDRLNEAWDRAEKANDIRKSSLRKATRKSLSCEDMAI